MTTNIQKQSAKYCIYCGAKFADYNLILPKFCPNCGKPNKASHRNRKSCSICFDPINSEQIIKCPYCGRFFHYRCLETWLRKANSCPFCMNAYLTPKNS